MAVARLTEGLARYHLDPADAPVRDGLIQRFEFTYDLAHKALRRFLEAAAADRAEVDRMTYPMVIRAATEQGLMVDGWSRWEGYRDMRNITSHTYDETKAALVAERIPAFVDEANALARKLTTRVGQL